MPSTLPHILVSVFLIVIGQLLVKIGMNSVAGLDVSNGLFAFYLGAFLKPCVFLGTLLYGLAVFFWIHVLSKVELSYAYPFLALTYVLVILAAWLILGEKIPLLRWIGLFVICFGVLLIAKSY